MCGMYIIAGLGNIGETYQGTRHNVGRSMVSSWVHAHGASFVVSKKYRAEIWEGRVEDEDVLALLPETFMNESGGSVRKAVHEKKEAEKLIVVYDDIDLPLGTIRIAFNRGSGGHNGIKSIVESIGTEEFVRIRVGISPSIEGEVKKPKTAAGVLRFVLGRFTKKEEEELVIVEGKVREALDMILAKGVTQAMNMCN